MAAYFGGDPVIWGDSGYDGGYLNLMGHLFFGGDLTSDSNPPTYNDINVGAPDF